jgi:hypothetical protein
MVHMQSVTLYIYIYTHTHTHTHNHLQYFEDQHTKHLLNTKNIISQHQKHNVYIRYVDDISIICDYTKMHPALLPLV